MISLRGVPGWEPDRPAHSFICQAKPPAAVVLSAVPPPCSLPSCSASPGSPPPPEICNNRQAPGETGISTSRSSRPRTGEPTWRLLPRCRFPLVPLRSLNRTPPQQQLRGARSAGRPWPLTGQRRLRICVCSPRRTRMSGGLLPAAHRRRTNGTTTSAGRSRCESVSLESVCAAPRSSASPRAAQSRGGSRFTFGLLIDRRRSRRTACLRGPGTSLPHRLGRLAGAAPWPPRSALLSPSCRPPRLLPGTAAAALPSLLLYSSGIDSPHCIGGLLEEGPGRRQGQGQQRRGQGQQGRDTFGTLRFLRVLRGACPLLGAVPAIHGNQGAALSAASARLRVVSGRALRMTICLRTSLKGLTWPSPPCWRRTSLTPTSVSSK